MDKDEILEAIRAAEKRSKEVPVDYKNIEEYFEIAESDPDPDGDFSAGSDEWD